MERLGAPDQASRLIETKAPETREAADEGLGRGGEVQGEGFRI